ncbi:MAG: cation-translocating P-type ATPase, partial [Nocardioidaceae bacterium]
MNVNHRATPESDRRLTSISTGLTSEEAARRRRQDGPNLLPKERPPAPWRLLLRQMTHFFAGMLWAAAGLALLAGLPPLSAAIVVVILLNGTFAFIQEHRADRAAARLRSLLPTRAQVRRDGQLVTVDVVDLVVGDVVSLTGGDRIGADMEIASAHLFAVDESMLTGESVAVRPDLGDELSAGTFVVEGVAEAVVTATGAGTRLAGIAELARSAHRPPSPLTVELHRVVRAIAILALCIGFVLAFAALGLGTGGTDAFLFGVGVTVALVPEGLLPTITLSLARGAERMADKHALVRRLEAVETLGATTFICTDKTGTLTRNEMSVVEVWTPSGTVTITGDGYVPTGTPHGSPRAIRDARGVTTSAARCIRGRVVERDDRWQAEGDPMEVAVDVLAHRLDASPPRGETIRLRIPFTPDRLRSTVVADGIAHVLGAPEAVLARCVNGAARHQADDALSDLTDRGLRVLAVARSSGPTVEGAEENDLVFLGLVGLEDPPRHDVAEALQACRMAGIAVAMVTGDHLGTAAAVGREVGLLGDQGLVAEGRDLPIDEDELANLLDQRDGVVVARVTPADKLRIARALR